MRGLGVVARVAHHEGVLRQSAQGLAGFDDRQRVGLFALETVATKHMGEEMAEAFALQQSLRKSQRLVGQTSELETLVLQMRQALHHTVKHIGVLTVDLQIVVLVTQPSGLVQHVSVSTGAHIGKTRHFGQLQLMCEHRANQMLGAFANGFFNQGA